jgi:hypothetical protein
LESARIKRGSGLRGFFNDPDMDHHVIAEIFVSCDQCVVLIILETDTGNAVVQPIEVLDSRYYRFRVIVRVYLNTQGQSCSVLGGLCEEELELNMLGGYR